VLRERIQESGKRDSGNEIRMKEYAGGFLVITGCEEIFVGEEGKPSILGGRTRRRKARAGCGVGHQCGGNLTSA